MRRVGKKHQTSYRVVVADIRSPRDGRFIEAIGRYNPRTEPSLIDIDAERARYWLSQGAQPSDAVAKLLEIADIAKREPKQVTVGRKARAATEAKKIADAKAAEEASAVAASAEKADAPAPPAEEAPAEEAPEDPAAEG